jgi:ArsR family transcriptional regulator, arsenate/arsenite/antimonite-responsive transcriptional repressor
MTGLTEIFKALTDPTRMQILTLLRDGDLTPSDMLNKLDTSQPTLSHHLDILKRAGLIEGKRNGQFIEYSLNLSVFEMAVEYMMKFINHPKEPKL